MTPEEAKIKAKEIKQFYIDELEVHRKNGNYKYEITPSMVQTAFILGFNSANNNDK